MKKFVIDVNPPYYFSLWNTEVFVHMRDINDEWSDEQIWNYAKDNNLTIITKDSDFVTAQCSLSHFVTPPFMAEILETTKIHGL